MIHMAKSRTKIEIGGRFGMVTVMSDANKDRFGHIQYFVRCDCGNEFLLQSYHLTHGIPMCTDCKRMRNKERKREEPIGKTYNNWKVLEYAGESNQGAMYKCRCTHCGEISVRNIYAVKRARGNYCQFCGPDIQYRFEGDTVVGVLRDGTEFLIDAEDYPRVSEEYWSQNKKGYIESGSLGKKHGISAVMLHRFIMNVSDTRMPRVDHINRNPLDCRKKNLRFVTAGQNSMNQSLSCANTSGYRGVSFVTRDQKFRAAIQIVGHTLTLGKSKDPIVCAQMYNVAAGILHRGYEGHLNDVPPAPEWIIDRVTEHCRKYKYEAMIVTQPCDIFYTPESA